MHALDERVLRDDEPRRRRAASFSTPTISPRRSSSASSAELTELREPRQPPSSAPGSVAARITATPAAPAPMQAAAFEASMPPIATTGTSTAAQIARSPSRPSGGVGVGLRRRLPDRADAEVVGVGRERLLERSSPSGRAGARPRARSPPVVALAEMHAVGAELERRVDVVVDDERRAERARSRRRARRPRRSAPSRAAGRRSRPPRPPRAPSRDPRRSRAPSRDPARPPVERRRVERRERVVEARRGTSPGPCAPRAASSPATPKRDERLDGRLERRVASTARKQPVSADDMQPVPVIDASSGSPFATAATARRRRRGRRGR